MSTVITNAPDAYDYGYVVPVGETVYFAYAGARGVPVRVVRIPDDSAAYQIGRYQSGMYIALTVDETSV